MTEDQARKLLRAIHRVEGLPHDKFHMPRWASADATETDCGTAGCFAGHCVGLFHSEGFRLRLDIQAGWPCPSFGGRTAEFAFAEFFGLLIPDTMAITNYYYRTEGDAINGELLRDSSGQGIPTRPIDVANRARMILEKHWPGLEARVERENAPKAMGLIDAATPRGGSQ